MDKTTTRLTTFLNQQTPHKEKHTSNSLIIHQVKIKRIITVKEVWILGILTILLLHLLFHFIYFILSFFDREDPSTTPDIVLSAPQKSWKFVKTTSLLVVFLILFSVFGFPDETLSLVCDIYHEYEHGWLKPRGKWHTLWNSSQFILFRPWLKKSGKAHKFRSVPSLWLKF